VISELGVAGGDVSRDPFLEAEPAEDAQRRGKPLLDVLALLLDGFEGRRKSEDQIVGHVTSAPHRPLWPGTGLLPTIARALPTADRAPSFRGRVAVVFVTTDPDRDTGPVIRSWLNQFNPSFFGLRGPLEQVAGYAAQLGVPLAAPRREADGTITVDHGAQVTAFGPDGVARSVYLANTQVDDYAHDISLLLKGTR
jgi:hypothetical protein